MPRKKTRRRLKGGNRWARATRSFFSKHPEYAFTTGAIGTAALGTGLEKYQKPLITSNEIPKINNATFRNTHWGMNEKTYNKKYANLLDKLTDAFLNQKSSLNFLIPNYTYDSRIKQLKIDGQDPDIFQLLILTISQPKAFFDHFLNWPVKIDSIPNNPILIEYCKDTIEYLQPLNTRKLSISIVSTLAKFIPDSFISKLLLTDYLGKSVSENDLIKKWIAEIQKRDLEQLKNKIIEIANKYLDKYDMTTTTAYRFAKEGAPLA